MLALLKWLLVLGTLAALFALVPVDGKTLLERAGALHAPQAHAHARGHARPAPAPDEADEEEPSPAPPRREPPAKPAPSPASPSPARRSASAARPSPLPHEQHSASDHAALDRLVTERAR
ncbi:hypothetical protein [Anaeromyxobacter paludicola]|uniref:Uncharacterized protein n=1 Tax=Anaeromyxobacter paludicola TaxID=2918171 RepID=A0ABN6N589_9BACT|nr:hypothetical protein [Anaeromyxobacter paludicola]BDG08306.1 hypothetical protein AMPC_14190 [Anaeromyxobacter paludicola]